MSLDWGVGRKGCGKKVWICLRKTFPKAKLTELGEAKEKPGGRINTGTPDLKPDIFTGMTQGRWKQSKF